MNNWQIKKISQVAIINPPRPKFKEWDLEREVDFLPMSVLATNAPNPFPAEKRKVKEVISGYTCFQSDDILLAKITPCFENGKSGIFKRTPIGIGFGSTEFIVIRVDKSKALPLWVWLYIFSSRFRQIGKLQMRGSAGQRRLPVNFVEDYQIPIPPLYIQQNIIEKLNTIRKLQEINQIEIKKAKELFDSLLTKVLTIQKNWEIKKLPKIAKVQRGKFTPRPRNDPKYFGGVTPWIQTGDVTNSTGLISSYSQTLNEKGLGVSRLFPKETIVVTIAANIGDFAVLGIDAAFPDSVVGIQADKSIIDNQFLFYQLLKTKSYLNQQATQAAQKNINLRVLSNVDIAFPPLKEQNEIVKRLDSVVEYKNTLLNEKTILSELFESSLNKFINHNNEN